MQGGEASRTAQAPDSAVLHPDYGKLNEVSNMNACAIDLQPHPDTPCARIEAIRVTLTLAGQRLRLVYTLRGDTAGLRLPPPGPAWRSDGLWRHTCMEAFIQTGPSAYVEYNFAPSGAWAAYAFDAYRQGMRPLDTPPPRIDLRVVPDRIELRAEIDLPPTGQDPRIALTAVIEDQAGELRYWAIRHPPGRPDFHDPHGFALPLPPAARGLVK